MIFNTSKKGQIWISVILFVLLISLTLAIVMKAGKPLLENMEDKLVFARQKSLFLSLDEQIREIASEGQGSQRVIPIEIDKGSLEIYDGTLRWVFGTDAKILEPGTEVNLGNVHVSSNADVFARETEDTYVLGNTYVTYVFTKCEDKNSCILNSSNILKYINLTMPGTTTQQSSGNFDFGLGSGSFNMQGYSELKDYGSNLGKATLLYYINSSSETPTIMEFVLGSRRDFVEVKIR